MPEFETDEHNAYFLATIYIHPEFPEKEVGPKNEPKNERDLDWNIIEAIINNKSITVDSLAAQMGKGRETIKRHLKSLQEYSFQRGKEDCCKNTLKAEAIRQQPFTFASENLAPQTAKVFTSLID